MFLSAAFAGVLQAAFAQQQTAAYPEPGQIQELATEIAAFTPGSLAFLAEWDARAAACREVTRIPLGNLRAPCRKLRSALRKGEILLFAKACYELGNKHTAQVQAYMAAARLNGGTRAELESALLDNERQLIESCSVATWRSDYPAFAALREQAADPRYRVPENRYYAENPEDRLYHALSKTLNATDADTSREAPVVGNGSFVTGDGRTPF
jgi:hypothetical protein